MVPNQVQHKRDGTWYPWIAGHVSPDLLRMKVREAQGRPVYVNGCIVYSLKFEDSKIWSVNGGWE